MSYFIVFDKHSVKTTLLFKKSNIVFIFISTINCSLLNFILGVSLYKEVVCFFVSKRVFSLFFSNKKHFNVIVFLKSIEFKRKFEVLYVLYKVLFKSENFFGLILHNLQNSSNVGACIRSAVSFGVSILFISGNFSCGLTTYTVRSSCGGFFFIYMFRINVLLSLINFFHKYYIFVIGVVVGDGKTIFLQNFNKKLFFLFGTEISGISSLMKKRCFDLISIPMLGRLNSLNVSCAVSIVLYETIRQRFFNF